MNINPGWITAFVSVLLLVFGVGSAVYKISKWAGSVDTDRTNFKKFMREIKTELRDIKNRIFRISSHLGLDVIGSQSPLKLTELGIKVKEELKPSEWIDRFADNAIDSVRGKEPYEIQEFCFHYTLQEGRYSDQELSQIRNVAYSHGLSEIDVQRVLGIELRDKLLDMMGLEAPSGWRAGKSYPIPSHGHFCSRFSL